MTKTFDVLIVGSGAAGLTAALNLAETYKVGVIAKGALADSATGRAQGGIAAVLEEGDSFERMSRPDDRRRGLTTAKSRECGQPRPIAVRGCRVGCRSRGRPCAAPDAQGGQLADRQVADATGYARQQRGARRGKQRNITRSPTGRDRPATGDTGPISRPGGRSTPYAYKRKQAGRSADRAPTFSHGCRGHYLYRQRKSGGYRRRYCWRGGGLQVSKWSSRSSTRPASTICRSRTS